jgi:hypothetical protein
MVDALAELRGKLGEADNLLICIYSRGDAGPPEP